MSKLVVRRFKETRELKEEERIVSKLNLSFDYNGAKYRLAFYDKDMKGSNKKWIFFLDQMQGEEYENILYYNNILGEDKVFEIEAGFEDICFDILLSKGLKEFFTEDQINTLVHVIRP